MFQVVTALNFTRPDKETLAEIKLRGYNPETFLTGQFARMLSEGTIKALSVSDIADCLCPSRRDLYYKKGKNKPRIRRRRTWGGVAGHIVEDFTLTTYQELRDRNQTLSYERIREEIEGISNSFKVANSKMLKNLDMLKSRESESSEWLINLLIQAGKMELGFKTLHDVLSGKKENEIIAIKDVETTSCQLKPKPIQIGISKPVQPDFLIEKFNAVGDIKSGIRGFKDYYLLTCAGYALAFENDRGKGNDVNFGIISFFPTRCSDYATPISFPQTYIFIIDDNVRDYFLRSRDEAYSIICADIQPSFPPDKNHCPYCQFLDPCKSEGLKI